MIFNYDKFPIHHKKTGEFGAVKVNTRLNNLYFDGKFSVNKKIKRFSNDADLLIKVFVATTLDNTKEILSLKSMKFDDFNLSLVLCFNRSDLGYFLRGDFVHTGLGEYISEDTYYKVRNKAIEMCNPNIEYKNTAGCSEVDSIFNLLHECENEEIDKFINYFYSLINEKRQKIDKPMLKILKN